MKLRLTFLAIFGVYGLVVACGGGFPPIPIPPLPTPKPTTTTTTTMPPPVPVTPHPVCTVEVPRVTDCYHLPPGSGWLYACPPVNGMSVNVPWGQEATCPVAPPVPPSPSPGPGPAPGVSGCTAPVGDWIAPQPTTTSQRGVVLKVLEHLSHCSAGTDCPLTAENQQSWQAKVEQTLRDPAQLTIILGRPVTVGLCAGQHDPTTDQIAVSTECSPGRRWESYYVFACTPARPGEVDPAGNPVDTCPIPGRGKVRWAIAADSWIPTGSCIAPIPPSPSPGPSPSPSPAPGSCPVTPSMLDAHEPFRSDIKPQPGSKLDNTLWACGSQVVATLKPHVPACLNFCCPLEGDKSTTVDLNACADALWGKGIWTRLSPPLPAAGPIITPTSNTNTIVLTGAPGEIKLCGSKGPEDLSKTCWSLHVTPPGCDPSSTDPTKCQKNRR